MARSGLRFCFAVKGNAYGHGLAEVARVVAPYADFFLVNSIEELRVLRTITKTPALVLGYIDPACLKEAVELGCIFGIFSNEQLKKVSKVAKELGVVQEVHLACDSLLGREGFLESELAGLFSLAKKSPHLYSNIRLNGRYSHFANIEDTTNFSHAQKQIDAYSRMQKIAQDFGYDNLATHISATSGLLVHEKSRGENTIVRIGVGMYGMWPSEYLKKDWQKKCNLKPVLTWKTHVAQVKILPKNSTIGYGLTFKTKQETKIALIPQGYADGYSRSLSNKSDVLIHGRRCRVLGRVSMNMFVVDVTRLPKIKEGDEVVLLGQQGKQNISAEELALISNTINYEVITKISPILPRFVV